MSKAWRIAGVLLVLTGIAPAEPAGGFTAGGFVGGASSNAYTAGPCPVLLRAPGRPADACVSNPHHGGRGPVLGGFARQRLLPWLHVEAGLAYARKGYDDGLVVDLHYLEAPLLVRLDPLASTSPVRVFVLGGVAPAVLLGCRTAGPIASDAPSGVTMFDGACADMPYGDRTPRRFDLGGVLGLGVGWQRGAITLEVQARLHRGLVDVDGIDTVGTTVNRAGYVVAGVGWHR